LQTSPILPAAAEQKNFESTKNLTSLNVRLVPTGPLEEGEEAERRRGSQYQR